MTTLQDVFRLLSAGELSQLKIGNQGRGILPEDQDGILAHANLGLQALYKRFTVKRGELRFELDPLGQRTIYDLTKANTESQARLDWEKALIDDPDADEPDWDLYFIKDAMNPFVGDINKVEAIFTEDQHPLYLNDETQRAGAMMLSQTKLRLSAPFVRQGNDLPQAFKTKYVNVHYRAAAVPIIKPRCGPGVFFEPSQVDLQLPDMYLEALVYFVASRVFNPVGMNQEFYSGDNYANKYEMECQRLEALGLELTLDNTNWGIRNKGFC